MRLTLPFPLPRLTAIIGGGGKTTLLFTLGRQLAAEGASVLLTTTTHLAWPPPEGMVFLAPAAPEQLAAAAQPGALVLAGYPGENEKMMGLSPEFFREACRAFNHVLCEADGSRHMPLKFHREDEPCIPAETGLLLQVAGLSALSRPAAETLHRHALSGIAAEHCITEEDVAHLMLRAFSHCGVSCPSAALLNQADTPELCARGETVARLLRAEGYPCAVGALRKEVIGCWF
ncbi:putative selenium-dependent hydroxylase accessory protein YqeC [bacterium]|nr:putative selenium-dependent hydroxylase accessory protein YqeC [bacterium]